jgi:hypothetical protein
MPKIDFKKELKQFYSASAGEAGIVDVPTMFYLMIDGSGDPNTSLEYKEAIEALYAIAYGLRFMVKKEQSIDYGVLPLEGLWWAEDMTQFGKGNKDLWIWTAMIMQPEYVTGELFASALKEAEKKKRSSGLTKIRLEEFHEGLSSQIMHIGPYSAEKPTIEKLHDFIAGKGYQKAGKHHEIYLSDPRKSAPERMRTIIRQPMKKKGK